jgi:hypothetical protein
MRKMVSPLDSFRSFTSQPPLEREDKSVLLLLAAETQGFAIDFTTNYYGLRVS